MNMNEKLLIMQEFLKNMGVTSIYCEGKLYIKTLDSKNKDEEISSKCEELGIVYVMSRRPIYGLPDPITLKREIESFEYSNWIEVNGLKNE